MKLRRVWLNLLGLLLIIALAVACGGAEETDPALSPAEEADAVDQAAEEPVVQEEEIQGETAGDAETITVWFHSGKGPERDALEATLDAFNASHPEIQVEAVQLPEGSYNDQVQAAALAGDLPCALDFDGPFLYNYAWSGYLIPIDDYLTEEVRNDFLPSIIEQGTYAGNLYSLGQFDSGLAIWGNREYLEEAGVRIPEGIDDPWTKEEFMSALESLQALDQVEYAIDFKMNYGQGEWYTYGFTPILWSHGGGLIDRTNYQNADGVLNSPESIEAMTFFQDLFEQGYANPEPAGDDDFYIDQITALSWVGHWMWEPHSENLGDNLVLIPMPDFGEGPKTGMGSWNWGITSNCANPEAAWTFIEFLVSPEEILRMTNANGAVPARQSAIEQSELYAADGPLNLFVQQLQAENVAIPRPVTPAYPVITNAFADVVQEIVIGADVEQELNDAVQTIDQDIEDNQGYPAPES
ncbi:MAG TPA: sugar ABC transporter substrate-binding protein [Anaerolineae bacterium]|nr:sugar ABC transporter substrate-binding protein [Anaerolineae bacterium]